MIADPVSTLAGLAAAYVVLRYRHIPIGETHVSAPATSTAVMCAIIVVVTLGLLARSRQYSDRRRLSALSDIGVLCRDLLIAVAAGTFLGYLSKGFFVGNPGSRLAMGACVAVILVLGVLSRVVLRQYQQHLFSQGRSLRRMLVVGTGPAAADFFRFVNNRPWLGIVPAGVVHCGAHHENADNWLASDGGVSPDTPVVDFTHSLEGLRRLDSLLRSCHASEVVVALDPEDQSWLPQVTELLALAHVPFKVIPQLFEQTYRTTELLGYSELPVVDVEVDPLDRVARAFKRTLDIVCALLGIIVLLPLELAIIVAIVAESGLPIIYKQPRVGKNGRVFNMYKFRTMVKDADARFHEVSAQNDLGDTRGRMFKMHRDPRITRVGAVLRKYSLDELPQFFNVLKKDMSIVGPRPPLPREVENYEREHLHRLRALPGITGMWQISGRNELSFDDMVRLDRYYLDNWSVHLDLNIMLKTVFVILGRKGAY